MGTAIKHPVPDGLSHNFWHLGTLMLCYIKRARMSEIGNRSNTGCFIPVPIWQ